jgi:siroheme synthase (precorrin-2 oxidase/ferrochelatase)
MTEDEIKQFIQDGIDTEISQMETFNDDIINKIKKEYERLEKERQEWLKNKEEHQLF